MRKAKAMPYHRALGLPHTLAPAPISSRLKKPSNALNPTSQLGAR